MNDIRKIIVSNGWISNQNQALEEVFIPSTVDTLDAPKKVTFPGKSLNWIPSSANDLEEIDAPNATSLPANAFKSYTHLTRVNFPSVINLTSSGNSTGQFYGCSNLTAVNLPNVVTISCSNSNNTSNSTISGAFVACTGLTAISLPALTTLNVSANNCEAGAFYNCTSLTTVYLPSLVKDTSASLRANTFFNCTNLTSVQLGSEGHPVTSLGTYMFRNCTQSSLTITVYTADGNALANSPFGATNATIVWEEA